MSRPGFLTKRYIDNLLLTSISRFYSHLSSKKKEKRTTTVCSSETPFEICRSGKFQIWRRFKIRWTYFGLTQTVPSNRNTIPEPTFKYPVTQWLESDFELTVEKILRKELVRVQIRTSWWQVPSVTGVTSHWQTITRRGWQRTDTRGISVSDTESTEGGGHWIKRLIRCYVGSFDFLFSDFVICITSSLGAFLFLLSIYEK